MRHVSRTHRVALDWLFDRINLDPRIQITYIDTKKPTCRHSNQGQFHTWRLESSSVFVLKWRQKERKKNQVKKESQRSRGQRWVLLQGLPQLCRLRRQKVRGRKAMKVRVPGVRKLRNMIERGNPLSAVTQVTSQCTTTKRYSWWDDDKAWSSQEWKADELMDDRTGTPVVCPRARTHEFQSSFSREKTKHVMLELPSKRSKATAIHHWRRRNRIGIVVRIQIILG